MFKAFKKYFIFKSQANMLIHMSEIIQPLYLMTSVLGLFPYSVKFDKTKNIYKIKRRSVYINSLCGVSLVLIILSFLALHIQGVLQSPETISMTEAIMTQMNYILELINFAFFCVVAYCCSFLNRTKYVKVLNMLISTWLSLPNNGKNKKNLRRLHFQVKIMTIVSLFILTVTQVCVNFTRENSLWKMVLVTITFILPQTIQFITLALYYAFVMMVVAILTNIKELCEEKAKRNNESISEVVEVRAKCITLRQMELAYVKAFEIKTYINEIFQGPILASTLQCFHSIVSEAHIIYHGIAIAQYMSTHDVINCSIWIFYQLLKIYTLAHAGSSLKYEAARIGQALHVIPTEKKDVHWLMEIQHFSSLIFYQKIEMTVYEYFPLDATLIYNMLASATMYLIILVQFDKRE